MRVLDAVPLTLEQLRGALLAVEPAVLLVPDRWLRRLIKQHRQVPAFGLQVPHADSYTLSREELLHLASPAELQLSAGASLPEHLILLPEPEPAVLAETAPALLLHDYWRRLFHARVHLALEQRLPPRPPPAVRNVHCTPPPLPADLRRRLLRLGMAAFDEIRVVLQDEQRLLPPGDERQAYLEFAALYLELRYFAPEQIQQHFPGLQKREQVDALLAEDVDADMLWQATRLAGAAERAPTPEAEAPTPEDAAPVEWVTEWLAEVPPVSQVEHRPLVRRAVQAQQRGNAVRAAVLLYRAAACGADTHEAARQQLLQLAARLQAALGLSAQENTGWRQLLPLLLPAAARRFWPVERRFLYDLQKICLDQERGVYALDSLGWLLSLGRRPLHRPLPLLQPVRAVKYLRRAAQRLPYLTLDPGPRHALSRLLEQAQLQAEERLRRQCRPVLRQALDQVCLAPANLPEEVARDKLIEELLDRIVAAGHLTLSDLRDALSRNQLKLPDLGACTGPAAAGPAVSTRWGQRLAGAVRASARAAMELAAGDPLLHLNRLLPQQLAGIYHRGEIYLRALQRLSSLAFGTVSGRFLTRFVAVPFGGAYVLLRGLDHLLYPLRHHLELHVHLARWPAIGLLGAFFLLLLNVAGFRQALGRALQRLARGLHYLFWIWPVWLWSLPWVQGVLHSPPCRFFRRYLLVPLLLGEAVRRGALWAGQDAVQAWGLAGGAFLTSVLFLASRWGRDLGEFLADNLVRLWQRLSLDLVPALVRWLLDFFHTLMELVARFLYTIDEWLLFRAGESRQLLLLKGIAGLLWFFLTYVIRFAVNVLIEPQINPIKHFPVVTVSHKLIWSLAIVLAPSVADLMGWEPAYALMVLSSIAWAIPGMFGFIAWELKENWYLYRANRPALLRPAALGPHGETLLRLLRWGFYSGTVPKLYRRYRRATRRQRWATAQRCRQALQHVAEAVHHFAERELVQLLLHSAAWAGQSVHLGPVLLAHNRLRLELLLPALSPQPLVLVFFEHAGWLLAGWEEAAALAALTPRQRVTLAAALLGLYQQAGVQLVQEQLEHCLPLAGRGFDLTSGDLILWPERLLGEVRYDLRAGSLLKPRWCPDEAAASLASPYPEKAPAPEKLLAELPVVPAHLLLFSQVPLRWSDWVAFWEQERITAAPLPELLPGWHVFPADRKSDECSI
jgi:hypothetical protein